MCCALSLLPHCGGTPPTTDGGDAGLDTSDVAPPDAGIDVAPDTAIDVAQCNDGGTACGSECVNTDTDSHHCGSCSHDCTLLPGVDPSRVACIAGTCDLSNTCLPNRGHCTAASSDGCETDLTETTHCGSCTNACPSSAMCTMSSGGDAGIAYACLPTCAVPTGTRCGTSCVDVATDATNCGACGTVCSAPANATARCVSATCDFACSAGYQKAGAACVPAPIRQIAPLSSSTVTSRRPLLRWELPGDADGAHVEICRDRTCSVLVTSFDAAGTSGSPAEDLPVGVSFWRVFSHHADGTVGTAPSVVWEFSAGARSATTNTSWGTILDVNGDGHPDAVASAPFENTQTGHVFVYLGDGSGIPDSPSTTLTGPDGANGQFGTSLASAGDLNGDGYADLVVGASAVDSNAGRAYVFYGSAAGLATTPSVTLIGPDPGASYFGGSVASAGDVNRDGFCDLIVGADQFSSTTDSGRAFIYLGSASGIVNAPSITLTGPDGVGGNYGMVVAGAGDLDGDGYADIVVSAPLASSRTGRVYVHLGGVSGISTIPSATLTGTDVEGDFGSPLASADDVNGDGYADLVVSAVSAGDVTGAVYVYLGGPGGITTTPATILPGLDGSGGAFGEAVATGDANGDGYADLVVGAPHTNTLTGRAYVYLGSAGGIATTPSTTILGPNGINTFFGASIARLGDANGDGYADFVIGSKAASLTVGRMHLYLGTASGIATTPSVTVSGPDGMGGFFGYCVAAADEANDDGHARDDFALGSTLDNIYAGITLGQV